MAWGSNPTEMGYRTARPPFLLTTRWAGASVAGTCPRHLTGTLLRHNSLPVDGIANAAAGFRFDAENSVW